MSPPRRGGPGRPGEKPQNFKKSMNDLKNYLRPWYMPIIIALLLSVAGTVAVIIAPDKMADLTNTIADGLVTGIDMAAVKKGIIVILVLYVANASFNFGSNYIMITVMQRLAWNMRNSISEKINKVPLGFYDKTSIGDILSRITNDVDTVSSTLNSSITTLVQDVLSKLRSLQRGRLPFLPKLRNKVFRRRS